jgi:DNA-binding protein YbaB
MSSAQAQEQVDSVLADLRARVARGREQQTGVMSVTGSASSQDGSVHVTVDASGVVTNVRFARNVFEKTSPERLAQTVTATSQAAAAQARERMVEAYEAIREPDAGVLSEAARRTGQLGRSAVSVPEVPRTAADLTANPDGWQSGTERTQPWQELAPDPAPRHRTRDEDTEVDDDNERPW